MPIRGFQTELPEEAICLSTFTTTVQLPEKRQFASSHDGRESSVSVSTPFSPLFVRAVPRCQCSEREPNVRSCFALSSVSWELVRVNRPSHFGWIRFAHEFAGFEPCREDCLTLP